MNTRNFSAELKRRNVYKVAVAAEIESIAQRLLGNANSRAALVVESQWCALERLSFSAVRTQPRAFSRGFDASLGEGRAES